MKKTLIIGSGFSSLATACYLAKNGYDVNLYEKNESFGGRASRLHYEGFTFDMGPTWYWMPDVFEKFFEYFGKKPSDYYQLERLGPAYRVYFGQDDYIDIPSSLEAIYEIFEQEETGSSKYLKDFIDSAKYNYEIAINDLVYLPGNSFTELITPETIKNIVQFFTSIRHSVRKKIKSKKLQQILEFPVLFLGAKPSNTPAFYSFMNYADFGLGTWHPSGGMYSVVEGMVKLAEECGVKMYTDSAVDEIKVNSASEFEAIIVNGETIYGDILVSGADYHHSETLLPSKYRQYSDKYWSNKTFAPSALMFYVGFDKKIENIEHHTLFFDSDFDVHAVDIYDKPDWPDNPLFYASFPSKSDDNTAPEGQESAIFLIPIAPGIIDTEEIREKYFDMILARMETLTHQSVKDNVLFKKSFCVSDFEDRYNSYKGNAYGLANTLMQTAFLRPKLMSKKVKNMYFTGQLTVPGPGVPPALISGKIVSDLIINNKN